MRTSAYLILLLGLSVAQMPGILAAKPGLVQKVDAGLDYVKGIDAWRQKRDASLRAEEGWLTLVGLFWFTTGEYTIGSRSDNAFVLPPSAPPKLGTFIVRGKDVSFRAEPGVDVRLDGSRVTDRRLRNDASESPDVMKFGTYSMLVIERGARLGLRVRDTEAETRKHFPGERWFPVSETFRVEAKWVPYDKPRLTKIPNIMGEEYDMPSPGYAVFTIAGREVKLEPVLESDDAEELFFIFKDDTSGRQTYPAGRFLYSEMPQNGRVILDFNKAYNPPCAFSPFATCPLPPPQNRVSVNIEAGALSYGH